jgi:coproporphyrinogen III oxidase-like Fe-S oxidoreductase
MEAFYVNKLFAIPNNWQNVLYVHTPFCVQKCFYCVYSSKVPDSPAEKEEFYQTVLPQQIEQYRPALEGVGFDQVYFGGGTPTIAAADVLEQLYRQLPGFRHIPFKASEASPYTVTDAHLELFHTYRFNYVSLGVQTLCSRILDAQNRLKADSRKLEHVCRQLARYGIVANIDLIFYLDSGELTDIEYSRRDLDEIMSALRPASITLHFNYMIERSLEKREAMMELINEMLEKYPEYRCVNGLLTEEDVRGDMEQAAEYRLMRSHTDLDFYMMPKIPQSHHYGYNMLALGQYGEFKPRYNYFYIYDFVDRYAYRQMLRRYKSIYLDYVDIRRQMGLSHLPVVTEDCFFKDEGGRQQFEQTVKEARLPYYDFNR